jgi:hypothetical protein
MVYFVMHPNLDIRASVEAPSTEKARTTFLDYLERTGQIDRASRQNLRRNLIASRLLDPGEAQTNISLSYGYEGAGNEENVIPSGQMREVPMDQLRQQASEESMVRPELEPTQRFQPEPEPQPQVMTPIQRLALGGG